MPSVNLLESTKMSVSEEQPSETSNTGEAAVGIEVDKENSPTAAVDLPQPSANSSNNAKEALSPVQQMCLIIEHKIRNLEKRKNKLDSYKQLEEEGKTLSNDQKMAILKYDECVTSLELARDLCKQFSAIATIANKDAKRQAKKSAFLKVQQESAKVRECLVILDVVNRFADEAVREDFLNGINGACQLTAADIELLMLVCEQSKPKRPLKSTEKSFSLSVRCAADVLSGIVDGKTKAFGSSNYAHVKEILNCIESCGYFDKDMIIVEEAEDQGVEKVEQSEVKTSFCTEEVCESTMPAIASLPASEVEMRPLECQQIMFAEAPAANAVPTPSFPLQPSVVHQSMLNATQPIIPTIHAQPSPTNTNGASNGILQSIVTVPAPNINVAVVPSIAAPLQLGAPPVAATTLQAVENAYFKQHYMHNPLRPLHEVLGNANFFFLQESEIDKPDISNLHQTYLPVEQPTSGVPLQAAPTEVQQFPNMQDAHLVTPVNASIQNNIPHSQLDGNRVLTKTEATFTEQLCLANDSQIMNVQPFQGPIPTQNSVIQNAPVEVSRVATTQPSVSMQLPPTSFEHHQQQQQQHILLPDPNTMSMNVNNNDRDHISGLVSSKTSTPSSPHMQDLVTVAATTHASAQTHRSVGIATNDLHKGNHSAYSINDSIVPTALLSHGQVGHGLPENNLNAGASTPSITRPNELHQTPKKKDVNTRSFPVNEVVKNEESNRAAQSTTDESFLPKSHGQSSRRKSNVTKANAEERKKEWSKAAEHSTTQNRSDQWSSQASSVTQAQLKSNESVTRNNFNRVRQSSVEQTGAESMLSSSSPGKNQSNGGLVNVKFMGDSSSTPNDTSNASQPGSNMHCAPAPPAGYRSSRSSNAQYSQSGLSNGRFNSENGATHGNPPTFFKNNERFYQNNYGPNRGGGVYKGRSENFGGNAGLRTNNVNAFSNNSSTGGNGTANPLVGSGEYRNTQNVRSGSNTRNNGSLGPRLQQKNNSANNAYSSQTREDSNARAQSGVNL